VSGVLVSKTELSKDEPLSSKFHTLNCASNFCLRPQSANGFADQRIQLGPCAALTRREPSVRSSRTNGFGHQRFSTRRTETSPDIRLSAVRRPPVATLDFGPRETVEHFTSFDGSDIAFLDEGTGRVVVLLHGFASDHRGNWVATGVIAAFVAAGRRVVAPDARGHGRSARPHDPASYGDDAMVKDVIALFDHLGVDEVDLVGYSMGSLISAKVATCDERVRTLVLGGVGGSWAGEQRPQNGNALADALETDDPSSIDEPIPRAFRAFADSTASDRLALAACQRSDRGEHAELSSIAVPTLVLTGDKDTLAGPPETVAKRIPGARFEVVHGNHLTVGKDPEFTRHLVSFVTASR